MFRSGQSAGSVSRAVQLIMSGNRYQNTECVVVNRVAFGGVGDASNVHAGRWASVDERASW